MAADSVQEAETSSELSGIAERFLKLFFMPGFPYLRFYSPLLDEETFTASADSDEQLLAAVHCKDEQLLVVTTRYITVYKLPRQKSFLERLGPGAVKFGLGFVPGVDKFLEVVDTGSDLVEKGSTVAGWVTQKKKKQKEKDRLAEEQGMPTSEMIENLAFDFKNLEHLNAILNFRERILIENGFKWKTTYRVALQDPASAPVLVSVEEKSMKIELGKKKVQLAPAGKDWNVEHAASGLMLFVRENLLSTGWTVHMGDTKLVLMKG